MAQVRWTLQAADDLEAICLFIARDAAPLAAIFADRVLRATERLASYPQLGRVVPELEIGNIREIIVGRYKLSAYLSDSTRRGPATNASPRGSTSGLHKD